ncbi:hypothetical protein ABPG75_002534 [Micractinium tetrahymenae]
MAARGLVHRGLAWLFLVLAFCGWAILLGGLAALQQACHRTGLGTLAQMLPSAGRRLLQNPLIGTVGYLAPVGCNKIFSYTWWIMAFDLFVLVLLAVGITTIIGTFRGGMVAISAVLLLLLMDTANTYLYFNEINNLTDSIPSRARAVVAGAIISCIAYGILIIIIGWHDEDASVMDKTYDAEAAGRRKTPHGAKKKGGFLGGLFGRGEERRREEEESVGAAIPGSPRMIPVESPPVAVPPQPMAGAGRAAPGPGGYMAGHPTTTTATTTATYTVAVPVAGGASAPGSPDGVPLSSPAAPVRYT